MDLEKYENFSQEDLVSLQNTKGGLIAYVRKGGKLPPIEFVNDASKELTKFCLLDDTVVDKLHHIMVNIVEKHLVLCFLTRRLVELLSLIKQAAI